MKLCSFFPIYWNLITVCCVTHLFFNCVCVKMIDNYSWSIHFNVSRQNDPIQTVNNDILAGMICEIECSQTDWQTNAAYTTRDTQQSNRRVKRANNYRIHCGLCVCVDVYEFGAMSNRLTDVRSLGLVSWLSRSAFIHMCTQQMNEFKVKIRIVICSRSWQLKW